MPPKETPWRRHRWLLALGLVPVLALIWLWPGSDDHREENSWYERRLDELRDRWPEPELPEGTDDFLAEAKEQACERESVCHILWADSAQAGTRNKPHLEMVAIIVDLDEEGMYQQTWAEWSDKDGSSETEVGDPRPLNPEAAALSLRPVDEGNFGHVWLFPDGAEDIREIRYFEGEVVVEELEQPDGDHFERVRTVPRSWWGRNQPAGTIPLLRYRDGGETAYSIGGNARVCAGEASSECHTAFPSEEVLVSLRTMWDHQNSFSWGPDDRFLLDASLAIAPDFDGLFDEPLSEGIGHVARISWTGPDSTHEGHPDQLTTHAVYFNDGAPALLSTYQTPENDTIARTNQAEGPQGIDGVALFPYTSDDRSRLLMPVSFHPSGRRILLAPELEEAGGGSGYTVHEPLDTEEPPSVAYVTTDEDGQPMETGWLNHGDVRP